MSVSPDKSLFTSCVLGEAAPEEMQAFEKALHEDAALRAEAILVSRMANRLSSALRQEPVVSLTLNQRHSVLNQSSRPASATRPVPAAARRAWVGTTLATLGVAAALVIGLYLIPASSSTPSGQATADTGIPSVTLEPSKDSRQVGLPMAPAPAVPAGSRAIAGIPETTPPENPAQTPLPLAMEATPPTIVVESMPAASSQPSAQEPAGKALQPGSPAESLAVPSPTSGK